MRLHVANCRRTLLSVTLVLACTATGCRSAGRNIRPLSDPPPGWARPVHDPRLEGLVILRRNDHLYNSAQPDLEQFKVFREMGIRAVVNVRRTHSDEAVVETLGMKYYSIPIPAWSAKEEHFVEFLRIATDPANQPLLVYCWYGGDRSNMLVAAYRVVVQGWSKEEAIREMTEGGTYFHAVWQNMVREIRDLDVDRLRRLAGISSSPASAGR